MMKHFKPGDRVRIRKNATPDFDRGKYAIVVEDVTAENEGETGDYPRLYHVELENEEYPSVSMWDWELKAAEHVA